jgi:hypothetical protein
MIARRANAPFADHRDHGAARLAHDPVDQAQRVLAALAEPDERHIRLLADRQCAHAGDVDRACDHRMPERDDDRRYEQDALLPLVCEKHSQGFVARRTQGCNSSQFVAIERCLPCSS